MRPVLRPDKPLDSEVQRIAARYLKRARSVLAEQPEGPHEAIHTARQQFKRVRSLYRLVATADRPFQKREDERVGALGRSLRASRDATSLVEVARRLTQTTSTAEQRMAAGRILQRLEARRDAVADPGTTDEQIGDAISACDEALEALADFRLRPGHKRAAQVLGEGWRKTGEKGAAALVEARDGGVAEAFHTLRKRAQDRWVHCRFLAEAWPAALKSTRQQTRQLVKLLGQNQDIALLSSFAEAHPEAMGKAKDLAHLMAVMSAEENRLRAAALPLAELIFPPHVEQDAGRIALLWRHAA